LLVRPVLPLFFFKSNEFLSSRRPQTMGIRPEFTTRNSRSKTRSALLTWPGSAVNLISGRHRHHERERARLLEWTLSSNPLRPRRNIQHAYLVYHDFGKFLLKSWLSNPFGRGECICPPSPTPPSLCNHPLPHLYPNSSHSTRPHDLMRKYSRLRLLPSSVFGRVLWPTLLTINRIPDMTANMNAPAVSTYWR